MRKKFKEPWPDPSQVRHAGDKQHNWHGPHLPPIHAGGPIDQYTARSGRTREQLERSLEDRDPNAVTLFAAEILFGELRRLTDAVERLANDRPDENGSPGRF